MFCPKCGESLPDGIKFCGACGADLSDHVTENYADPEPVVSETNVQEFGGQGMYVPESVPEVGMQQEPAKQKMSKNKIIGIAAVGAIALVLVVVLISVILMLLKKENAYVYVSNGKYELLTDLEKGKNIEVATTKNDEINPWMVVFTPDGKYVYYYTKYDSYEGTGSLCRARYGKLKDDSDKNDKYIEIIETNVKLGIGMFDDGTITYQTGEGTLYYYDGKESSRIAKNVSYYYIAESKRVIYAVTDEDENDDLYGVELDDPDNKIKLAANFYSIISYSSENFDEILYTKTTEEGKTNLYSVGFEKDSEKIGENVGVWNFADGQVYFTADNGSTVSPYDYIIDDYAEADASIKEPDKSDYTVPYYHYYMVYGSNLSEDDFGELYTSCTKDLYWYGESTWWSYSMEDAVDIAWEDGDAINKATQAFIDKYADSADEDGYILVTDEVKADLKKINQSAGVEDWKWLWLCYTRVQNGTTTDYDAYSADQEKYNEAADRIEAREILKDHANEYSLKTLYYYDNGEITTIAEDVLRARGYSGAVMYNTTENFEKTMTLDDFANDYVIENIFALNLETENYVLRAGQTESWKMSKDAAETHAKVNESGYTYLYFTDKAVYMEGEDGELYVASISKNTVNDFSIITDDADVLGIAEDSLYYLDGVYENNDCSYGDLYVYSAGKENRLAKDVLQDKITIYEDGSVIVYTGYSSSSGYEMLMLNTKGEKEFTAEDVTQYIRVDKSTLLYISDGDLYVYNGKDKERVQKNVDWIWSFNSMDITRRFFGYNYAEQYYYYD